MLKMALLSINSGQITCFKQILKLPLANRVQMPIFAVLLKGKYGLNHTKTLKTSEK
jgi:hypothetical protein